MYALPSLFVPILIGKFLDKAKAVGMIQLAVIGYALPIMLFPYASNFLLIAGLRAVQGFFGITFWVAIEKELSDIAAEVDKGRILGVYNASWGTAFMIGPIAGGFLIQEFGYWTTFLFALLWQLGAFLLLLAVRPSALANGHLEPTKSSVEERNRTSRIRWRQGDLLAACLTSGVTGGILGVLFSLFPAYASLLGFSALGVGFLVILFTASRLVTFLSVGHFTERVGERKFMVTAMIFSIAIVVLGLTADAELLAFGLIVLGVASGMGFTAGLTLVSHSPSVRRGSAVGRFEFSMNLGIALMSQLGGISADVLGSWTPYVLTSVLPLLGLIGLLAIFFDGSRLSQF
jgi:DHA1 family quinolone resistance protein-like MFS transporter